MAGASAAAGAGGFIVDYSVTYNDDDSPRMIRTPAIAGNRLTGTLSLWYKRGNLGSIMQLFNAGAGDDITFNASDKLTFSDSSGVSYITTQVFRDPTAWGHLVFAWDTTLAAAGDRLRIYHNGVEITAFDTETNPSQFDQFEISNTVLQTIGANESENEEFDGYLSQINYVDGNQHEPTSFGEFDGKGIWRPIAYSASSTAAAISFLQRTVDTSNLTTYTFSGQNLGAAASDRVIVCFALDGTGTGTPSSVTIGGIAATLVLTPTTVRKNTLWYATVPTGTSGDVVVTSGSAQTEMGIALWRLTGVGGPYDFGQSDANPGTTDISVPVGGVALAGMGDGGYSHTGYTWVGLTEDFDENIGVTNTNWSGASATNSTAQDLTITATPAHALSNSGFQAVSFGPSDNSYGTNGFSLDFASEDNSHRYWRVRFDSTAYYSSQWHSLAEVEYFTAAGQIAPATLASYTLVGAVSNRDSTTALAYNGVTDAGIADSAMTLAENGHWAFGLDFTTDIALTKVIGYGPNDYGIHYNWNTDMYFEYSDDAVTWVNVASEIGVGTSTSNVVTLETPTINFGLDTSGNNNDFSPYNLIDTDRVTDTPTTNYCIWASLRPSSVGLGWTYQNGNRDAVYYSTASDNGVFCNIGVSEGKWYWEFTSSNNYMQYGIVSQTAVNSGDLVETDPDSGGWDSIGGDAWSYSSYTGKKNSPSTSSAYGALFTTEVMGIAVDLDNDIVWFSKSGVYQGGATIAEVEAADDSNAAFSGEINGQIIFPFGYAQTHLTISANFGQSTFAGTVPTGFQALNTANIPSPQRIDDVDSQFVGAYDTGANIVTTLDAARNETWTNYINMYRMVSTGGTGANWQFSDDPTNQLTLPGPSPGAKSAFINPSVTNAAAYWNGYTWRVGAEYGVYTAEISHTNGADTDQAHGLTSDSSRFMAHSKRSDAADEWWINHPDLSSGNNINFYWAAEVATEYVTVDGTNVTVKATNATGTYRVIVWAEMSGWRKFGKFTGNTNVDGPFLWINGTPKLHVAKRSTAGEDYHTNLRARDPNGNPITHQVTFDWTNAETTTYPIDGTAGAVKIRNTGTVTNGTAMITWNECTPFGGDGVTPATAV